MPGFDGKGPRGTGPFSGGGRGYCSVVLPQPEEGQAPYGYAGLQGIAGAVLRTTGDCRMARPHRLPRSGRLWSLPWLGTTGTLVAHVCF